MNPQVDKCAICLEDLTEKNIVILDCGHKFDINCYLKYAIHKAKDIINSLEEEEIKCPMCRKIDANMIVPLITELQENIDDTMVCKLAIGDFEDLVVKQLYPNIMALLDGASRFSKRNLVATIRSAMKTNNVKVREILRDVRL